MATTKPVKLLLIGQEATPALLALAEQGHTVEVFMNLDGTEPFISKEYDAILGPKCWRYLPEMSDKWLALLVKEARALQPPRVKKATKKKKGTDGTSPS